MRLTPAVASVLPSGEKAIPNIATGSSSIRASNSPLRVFQARRLVSQLPAARTEPSGENASEEVPQIPRTVLPSLETATTRTSDSEVMVRSWAAAAAIVTSNSNAPRMSGSLQHEIESHCDARRVHFIQQDRPHQLAALRDVALAVVLVHVAFEKGIGCEINLGDQRLVPGRGNQVVNVL